MVGVLSQQMLLVMIGTIDAPPGTRRLWIWQVAVLVVSPRRLMVGSEVHIAALCAVCLWLTSTQNSVIKHNEASSRGPLIQAGDAQAAFCSFL